MEFEIRLSLIRKLTSYVRQGLDMIVSFNRAKSVIKPKSDRLRQGTNRIRVKSKPC